MSHAGDGDQSLRHPEDRGDPATVTSRHRQAKLTSQMARYVGAATAAQVLCRRPRLVDLCPAAARPAASRMGQVRRTRQSTADRSLVVIG